MKRELFPAALPFPAPPLPPTMPSEVTPETQALPVVSTAPNVPAITTLGLSFNLTTFRGYRGRHTHTHGTQTNKQTHGTRATPFPLFILPPPFSSLTRTHVHGHTYENKNTNTLIHAHMRTCVCSVAHPSRTPLAKCMQTDTFLSLYT